MTVEHTRSATLGGGWSLVLTDLAAILLCFFALAIALTPPARSLPQRPAGPAEESRAPAPPALDTAISAIPPLADPSYLAALLGDRLLTPSAGITVQRGADSWLLRYDHMPSTDALEELLQAVAPLPLAVTVTLVTPASEIQRQAEEQRVLARELGAFAGRALVSHGPAPALEVRLAFR
jgi:hypothetical protein